MLGVTVNAIAVIFGSLLGLVFKKGIPEKISDSIQVILGFATAYVGISGALSGKNILVTILALVFGAILGTLVDFDKRVNDLGSFVERKLNKGNGKISIAQGFVTTSLLFCVGSMTIVGSLQAGINGNNEMLFTKSLLDCVLSIILTSTLGIGVMLSAVCVFISQGSIALLAGFIAPYLGDAVIAEMTCTGSILVIAIGTNLAGITKVKVANYLPAVFAPILICPAYDFIAEYLAGIF